jgi:hypothetical protein
MSQIKRAEGGAIFMSERPTFIVHLRPEPGVEDPIRSLRHFLKRALRSWGLRCVDIREERAP